MKTLIPLILLLFISGKPIDYDLGAPTIQAVCKVTMSDGTTKEGFITFGSGGYELKYRTHGFCIQRNGSKVLIPYNFDFELSKDLLTSDGRDFDFWYLENISDNRHSQKKTEFDEKSKILKISVTETEKYKLSKKMVVFEKIPLDLYLDHSDEKENGKVKIHVKKIQSVELLKKPSKASLEVIENARKKQIITEKKDGYWTDYQPPVWYHEIIDDKEMVETLSQYF